MNELLQQRIARLSPVQRQLLEQKLHSKNQQLPDNNRILPGSRSGNLPASFSQQRLWFLSLLEPENWIYNRPANIHLDGELNISVLERCLNEIIRRHQVLRSNFVSVDGRPTIVVSPEIKLNLAITDLSKQSIADRDRPLQQLLRQFAQHQFDLAKDCLFTTGLVKLAVDEYILLLTFHHSIFDAWSMDVLLDEMTRLYDAYSQDKTSSLPDLEIQYSDFANWQIQQFKHSDYQLKLDYWKQQLGGELPILALPTDRSRPPVQTFNGATCTHVLSLDLTQSLKQLSQNHNVTLFMTLLAAYQVLLYRYSGQTDIIVGTPIAGRDRLETENLIGVFINTLVLRTQLAADSTFEDILAQVRRVALEVYTHQEIPFEKLVEELQPERNLSHLPLVQTLFQLRKPEKVWQTHQGLKLAEMKIDREVVAFDLCLDLTETNTGLVCRFEYNTDLFDLDSIERMAGHFTTLLAGIVADPQQSISSLPLLTAAEQQQLSDWNQTQTAYPQACIHQLFEERVAKNPDAIAVVFEERQLTYRELNDRSNQLAHHLQSLGVQPEVLVGICVERSVEMVVGILGILKAGGAYLPLDPSTPTDRLAYILTDAQSTILVTDSSLLGNLPNCNRAICLDTDLSTIDRYPTTNLDLAGTADNLAYVIYTSGSTGNPKGVLVTHSNVVRLFTATAHWYRFDCQDVWTLFHSFAFDFSVWEIWGALLHGGRLVVVPYAVSRDLDAFYQLLISERVTVLNQTPSAFDRLITSDARSPLSHKLKLRLAIFGGEALNLSSLKPWFDRHGDKFPQLVNMYGITETTVHVTYRPLTCEDVRTRRSFIGRPIPDLQVYVLDPYLQPLPIGAIGEMYVGGAGVSRGYWQRDELTNTRFIPNPSSACPTARLYRTGDLARYLPDGQLEYIGRIDNQVKLRGFRIELGEIETVLSQHPAISRSTVIVREDTPGNKQLVAYWMSDRTTPPQISELRDFIAQKLPNYMVPSAFVQIDSLPLTPNGKIDRHALPTPDRDAFTSANTSYSPPKTPLEQQLVTIWSKLLKLERVGIHDNFFELGGHSLLAIKLVMEIATTLDLEISLQQLWQTPTIAELATSVAARPIGLTTIPRRTPDLPLPLSFSQQRLWFLERLDPDAGAYHIPVLARLTGTLDLQALQQALDAIVAHHEVLRTNFSGTGDRLVQVIRPPRSVELLVLDFQVPAADLELRLQQEILHTFDLEKDLMLRGCVAQISPQEQILLVTIHHIAADGWSMGIFAAQLESLYQAYCDDRSPELPALPIQYADFTLWQRQWLQGEVFDSHLAYWQQQLAGAPPILSLPIDRPRPAIQTFTGSSVSFTVDRELIRSLTQLSRQAGVTLFMTLLAAFDILLYRYTGSEDLIVGVPVANRDRREIAESIGCFVNTLVLRGDLSGNPSFHELLERIERMAVGAYSHQDLPFDVLVDRLQPQRDLSYSPIFQVLFGFEEDVEPRQIQLANLITSPYALPRQTAKFDLSLALEKQADSLVGIFTYNTDLFEAATIERMVGHFQTLLAAIVVAPQQSIASLPLLTTAEQQKFYDWNQTQTAYPQACIHQLFEERVAKNPDAIAVVFEAQQLTYRELNDRSNQLARHLQGLGVKPDVLVGIYVERSLEMVVGLLGVLKAGGAYVPLDPSYPVARLSYMVANASVEILLTQQALLSSLPSIATRVICLDADWERIDRQDTANLPQQVTSAHLAYTIYTSGSTGKPKGVQICHRSVTNFLNAMQRKPGLTERDTLLSVTTISFDIAVLELYLPLTVGAKIVLASREIVRDGRGLLQLLTESQATVMQATPTTWQLLLAAGWTGKSQLKKILCGGEALSTDLASQLIARSESVWNLYGPTEATVWVTIDRVDDLDPATVSIGRPIDNIQTYILDSHLQPVPIGVPGELYIGGDCLATGYLVGVASAKPNRPDLTAQKFITNPFSTAPQARLYKTGDLVKYLPNGKIQYLSRLDDLVKLRGVRIELGEIESLLATHPEIRSTVAIVREDTPGDKRLVVYIIPDRQQSPPQIRDLHDFLAQKLPRQSLPSAWVMLADFPTTPNGKIDRHALPVPDLTAIIQLQTERVAPRNSIESRLLLIWTKVLGLEDFGIHDNFFDLGGHSLLAVNMFGEIDRIWGVNLPLATLFQSQTIAELATTIAPTIANIARLNLQLPVWNSLVKIKQGDSIDPPMFFIHDVSGSVLFYREIADRIRSNRTFYVLQPRGMDGRTPPVTSITEMAANYIEEILRVQAEGAYYLSGYSFGGFVAFEIARQLHELGKEVKLLAIIDTSAPRSRETAEYSASPPDKPRRNHSRLAKFLRLSSHERIDYLRNGLRIHRTFGKLRLPYQFYLRYIKRSLSEAGSLDVYWTNARAFTDYVAPSTYPGRVTLFYSDEKPQKLAVNLTLNWDNLATGGVELEALPGSNHATIIRVPHVNLLSEKLTFILDRL
ncbi:non-ribosomal peptide synthetase [Chamaesiphon sp. VAR_48_metabat_135_sub]|uniref:non-ribosomal peptide synthetase n=1 Tax=Chamaesiphon sp. VAR_48_metabat_135_sub TaxID=2964699 RepID=UPI00286ABF44|nr:non-ribosomal peptide synthetase [Chamaesiphon sp. VAR_48_metabat_135_sub]